MPADNSLSDKSADTFSSGGDAPYPYCYNKPLPSRGIFQDYGYCRHSLDLWPEEYQQGSSDPRCPRDCTNKASEEVAVEFQRVYKESGNAAAAKFTADNWRMKNE